MFTVKDKLKTTIINFINEFSNASSQNDSAAKMKKNFNHFSFCNHKLFKFKLWQNFPFASSINYNYIMIKIKHFDHKMLNEKNQKSVENIGTLSLNQL